MLEQPWHLLFTFLLSIDLMKASPAMWTLLEAIKQGDKCDWEQSHRLQVPHLWFRLVHPKTEDKLLLAGGYGTKVNGHHLVPR